MKGRVKAKGDRLRAIRQGIEALECPCAERDEGVSCGIINGE